MRRFKMFALTDDEALDLLLDRVRFWNKSEETVSLYEKMYQRYLDEGIFEGGNLTINYVVDNDVVNYCSIVSMGDDDFEKIKELYKKGEYDVSCEHLSCGASFIEAADDDEDPTCFLIRQ